MNKIENAEAQVNYCLQQAYKIAVRVAGITDWSKIDNPLHRNRLTRHVELLQVEIAKMLNENLNNILKPEEVTDEDMEENDFSQNPERQIGRELTIEEKNNYKEVDEQ